VVFSVRVRKPQSAAGRLWNLGQDATAVFSLTLIALKLAGLITWSWWWVLSPLWISGIVVVTALVAVLASLPLSVSRRLSTAVALHLWPSASLKHGSNWHRNARSCRRQRGFTPSNHRRGRAHSMRQWSRWLISMGRPSGSSTTARHPQSLTWCPARTGAFMAVSAAIVSSREVT
jgi:hypothetical protein